MVQGALSFAICQAGILSPDLLAMLNWLQAGTCHFLHRRQAHSPGWILICPAFPRALLGLAQERRGVRLESFAVNWKSSRRRRTTPLWRLTLKGISPILGRLVKWISPFLPPPPDSNIPFLAGQTRSSRSSLPEQTRLRLLPPLRARAGMSLWMR